MKGPVHISETRQGKTLARIALWGEQLAEASALRAQEAETADEFKIYLDGFAKVTRGVRMTLALENRLMRDTARHEREHRAEHELQTKEARARRRQRLYTEIAGEICDAYEAPEFRDDVLADLQEKLEEEVRLASFAEEPLDYQLDRLRCYFDLGPYHVDDEEDAEADDEDDAETVEDDEDDDDDEAPAPVLKPRRYAGPPGDRFEIVETTVIGGPPHTPDSS